MKKPVIFFTIADEKNMPLAKQLENSFKKFHPDIPFEIYSGKELRDSLAIDPMFFYRATPLLAEKYMKDYELVVKIDADSLVLGDLSYIWKTTDYDVACVLNFNAVDAQQFGAIQGWGISPMEYVNCGLVCMRSEKFVHEWSVWCTSPQFDRTQFKEQDGLNIKVYHGNWNVRILDHMDKLAGMQAWWGLIAKSEWHKAIMKGDKVIIPQSKDNFPPVDVELKVVHMAGGKDTIKDNWGIYFSSEVLDRINYLRSDKIASK